MNDSVTQQPTQWWFATNGKSEGPVGIEEILAKLNSKQLPADSLLCPVGGTEWKVAEQWPDVAARLSVPEASSPPEADVQWWIGEGGASKGPFTHSEVRRAIRKGRYAPSTLACPVGGDAWKPLSVWPDFRGLMPPPLPTAASAIATPGDHLATNPELPAMANWIIVYCIVFSPILVISFLVINFTTPPDFVEGTSHRLGEFLLNIVGSLVSIAIAVYLFIAGPKLHELKRSGFEMIRNGMWAYLLSGTAELCLWFKLYSSATQEHLRVNEVSDVMALVSLLLIVAALAATLFQIVALRWLYKNEHSLALVND